MKNYGKNIVNGGLCVLVGLSFAACSAGISGGEMPDLFSGLPQASANTFNNDVQGPSLDGIWKSACVQDYRESGKWDLITLTISGQNMTRLTNWFSDAACAHPAGSKSEVGLFRFMNAMSGGGYALEYRFNMQNGTYTQYENVNLSGSTLYISNEIGGDAMPDVALNQSVVPTFW